MDKFKPFSNNIIFLDTEFSSMDPRRGEILSLALVKLDGSEFYIEIKVADDKVDDWQKQNILPMLTEKKHSPAEAAKKVNEFVGKGQPYVVAYVNIFDMVYLYKIIPQPDTPFVWLPIDFASMLFSLGYDPEIMTKGRQDLYEKLNIDTRPYRNHHALDDARLLREVYLKLIRAHPQK